jgi:hypothetical protein
MMGRGLRRGGAIVAAIASTVAAGATPASAVTPRGVPEATADQLGVQAYKYGIPLLESELQAARQTSVTVPDTLSDAPVNELGSARQLATAAHQPIVQPNNDTLYTMGHLQLAHTALVLHVPRVTGGRYYSFEFLDPYTNVFHYVGTRTTGDGPGTFLITGPRWHGTVPAGTRRIRSSYDEVWLVGRTYVSGPSDLPAVHRIQDQYRLIPLAAFQRSGLSWRAPTPSRIVTRPRTVSLAKGLRFFDALGTALERNPPPARDRPLLRKLAMIGVGPGLHPSSEHLTGPVLAGLAAAARNGASDVAALRTAIATKSVVAHHGWFVPPMINGAYGTNYAYRAVVALNGLAANRPAEALYIIGVASPNGLLTGAHRYVIHFGAGQLPPARYFWSLTMYDGGFHLIANPLDRYELGSRTAGLRRNADGSLDLYIQHAAPAGHRSNWLPAPASGTFEVTLRLYGPRASALSGRYTYPPITQTG